MQQHTDSRIIITLGFLNWFVLEDQDIRDQSGQRL